MTSIGLLNSCTLYKQGVLLNDNDFSQFQKIKDTSENAYLLQAYDRINLKVYANSGELIIDPDFSLRKEIGMTNSNQGRNEHFYTIQSDSTVYLPMLDTVRIAGLSIQQAEIFVASLYNKYYAGSFVKIEILNRRVVVISNNGSTVVPLEEENMNLFEVLALSGTITEDVKAQKIRLIRGDLNNPQVEIIDLSTIQGMTRANLKMEPNDIVYLEPVQYVFRDALRDVAPVFSLVTSIASLVILFISLSK